MPADGADVNRRRLDILAGRYRLFGLAVHHLVDIFGFQSIMDAAYSALFTLELGHSVKGGVHLDVLVILALYGGRQVSHSVTDAAQLAQVVGGVNLLGVGDGPKEPRYLGIALTLGLVGKDSILYASLALAGKSGL